MRAEIVADFPTVDDLIFFVVWGGICFQVDAIGSEIPRCKNDLKMVVILASAMQWREQCSEDHVINGCREPPYLPVCRQVIKKERILTGTSLLIADKPLLVW